MPSLTIALAQTSFRVGDINWNVKKLTKLIHRYEADIYVFPELSIIGYPPEDLLLRESLTHRVDEAVQTIIRAKPEALVVFGAPLTRINNTGISQLENCALAASGGEILHTHAKLSLPNYQVFDEKRYFAQGERCAAFVWRDTRIALTVCEDLWQSKAMESLGKGNADLVLNLNASPYHSNKQEERIELVRRKSKAFDVGIAYVNQVGGQDELVFDGGSMVADPSGKTIVPLAPFADDVALVEFQQKRFSSKIPAEQLALNRSLFESELALTYQALVVGVQDYVEKNGFRSVVLGLSGGIDSALTLAIAVDALGADRVRAIMMPYRYTSQMSLEDAATQAKRQQVKYDVIEIEPAVAAFEKLLAPVFHGSARDTTEENLQARSRGLLLMAISNKTGAMVLTTGNKSEMSVGYATLYGDMAGGLDVLKDVPKMQVFALAKYRNQEQEIIPQRVIDRPPSAELSPDQIDEDSLPSYPVLDAILERYIELDQSADTIVSAGFDKEEVYKVLRLVDINEYKRRQAAPGIRISRRAFGRDRRYPITNGWQIGS